MNYSLKNVTTDGWTAVENSEKPKNVVQCGSLCQKRGEDCNAFYYKSEEGVCYLGKVNYFKARNQIY